MLTASFAWETWKELENRNTRRLESAITETLRVCENLPLHAMAEIADDHRSHWLKCSEAFLVNTAAVLGIDLDSLVTAAANGEVTWRAGVARSSIEVSYRDRTVPLGFREWIPSRESFDEYQKTL